MRLDFECISEKKNNIDKTDQVEHMENYDSSEEDDEDDDSVRMTKVGEDSGETKTKEFEEDDEDDDSVRMTKVGEDLDETKAKESKSDGKSSTIDELSVMLNGIANGKTGEIAQAVFNAAKVANHFGGDNMQQEAISSLIDLANARILIARGELDGFEDVIGNAANPKIDSLELVSDVVALKQSLSAIFDNTNTEGAITYHSNDGDENAPIKDKGKGMLGSILQEQPDNNDIGSNRFSALQNLVKLENLAIDIKNEE